MKSIAKFIALIAIVIGVVVGIFYISTRDPQSGNIPDEYNYASELRKSIENRYRADDSYNVSGWDKEAYISIFNKINTAGKFEDITKKEQNSLLVDLQTHAVRALDVVLKREYNKTGCKLEDNIKPLYINGVNVVKEKVMALNNDGDTDGLISLHSEVYNLYKAILKFGNNKFSLEPEVKIVNGKVIWNDFEKHIEDTKKLRKQYINKELYATYLKNIQEVKSALSEESMMGKLYEQREGYPKKVKDAIIKQFKNKEKNSDNYDLLNETINAFRVAYPNEADEVYYDLYELSVKFKPESNYDDYNDNYIYF